MGLLARRHPEGVVCPFADLAKDVSSLPLLSRPQSVVLSLISSPFLLLQPCSFPYLHHTRLFSCIVTEPTPSYSHSDVYLPQIGPNAFYTQAYLPKEMAIFEPKQAVEQEDDFKRVGGKSGLGCLACCAGICLWACTGTCGTSSLPFLPVGETWR
jgi:hypothetical protein